MNEKFNSLKSGINSVISFFEKKRFNILTLFLYIVFLSAARMWLEALLIDYPYKEISYDYLFVQVHLTCFFITSFIGGLLILKFFSKISLSKVANLTALGFTFVLLPPFIDVFILNNPSSYTYGDPNWVINIFKLFTFQLDEGFSAFYQGGEGIIYELFLILIMACMYVFIKTKSILKTLGAAASFFVLFIFIGSPQLILLRPIAGQLLHPLYILRYLIISIILLLFLIYICNKKLLKSFIKSSRLITTTHFAIMTIIGIFISGHILVRETFYININDVVNLILVFLRQMSPYEMTTFIKLFIGNIGTFGISVFCIIFVWQYAVMINHVYDEKIDALDNKERLLPKKFLSKKQVKHIAIIYAIIALILSVTLGIFSFLLVAFGLFLGTIYSVKPVRLRDTAFSTLIIGAGSTIAFFIGYVTPAYIQAMHGINAGEIIYTYPEFTTQVLFIGLIIFIALSVGPLAKDYKDYQGDKKTGVKNLFTIYGVEKGVKIVSILLPFTFFMLILLFNSIVDVLIFVPLGLLAGFLFYRFKKTEYIFALYFPVIIYCLIRWFQIIQF